ncbi:hypothetical protein [Simplicispira psychrophila]|uniref:hypothetical protein n=1 Tax=Simplicispira psychrophila TaxID=80882 RepID=UPI0012EB81CB|nr:hypothetical protein [Simplicispira psychrophila]
MSDTKFPLQESTCLTALKTALVAEQRVLDLAPHTARARTDTLLGATPSATWPASVSGVAISRAQALL